MTPRDVTYADLRDGDLLRSQNGRDYPVSRVLHDPVASAVTFVVDGKHAVAKHRTDPATITRDWEPEAVGLVHGPNLNGSVQTVEKVLGGSVEVEMSDSEQSAADAASVSKPAVVPLSFEAMTDLEKRSHLYVFHVPGVWPKDYQSRAEMIADHKAQHAAFDAGELNAPRYIPHVHTEGSGS